MRLLRKADTRHLGVRGLSIRGDIGRTAHQSVKDGCVSEPRSR